MRPYLLFNLAKKREEGVVGARGILSAGSFVIGEGGKKKKKEERV